MGYSQLTNNIVIISGEEQRDSAIHIHVSTLPQTPLLSRLPHNIQHSSLCYTVGPYWLAILNIHAMTLKPSWITCLCTCADLKLFWEKKSDFYWEYPHSHLQPTREDQATKSWLDSLIFTKISHLYHMLMSKLYWFLLSK